jgi:hypothetical protein
MNKLIVDSATQTIEWDLQSVRAATAEWILEEYFSNCKIIKDTNTYKVVSTDDTITYVELPIQITVLKYI